ncbi:MAG: hypothetical protein MZU97_11970 [Bacillus subtilis]|nr:hypothetical protein [Bacillus subtilis]
MRSGPPWGWPRSWSPRPRNRGGLRGSRPARGAGHRLGGLPGRLGDRLRLRFGGQGGGAGARPGPGRLPGPRGISSAAKTGTGSRPSASRIPRCRPPPAFALAFGELPGRLPAGRAPGIPRRTPRPRTSWQALTAFLRELDGTAVERRFDLPDADPFPDARARTLAFLKERTTYVRERRLSVDGGLGGATSWHIREELR